MPDGVTLPRLLTPLSPEYPANGTTNARVVIAVTLDATGAVTDVNVLSGSEPFSSAAVRAVRAGRFAPATLDGKPIPAKLSVAVDFTFAATPSSSTPTRHRAPAHQSMNGTPSHEASDEDAIDIIVLAPRVDDSERAINSAEARVTAGTFGDPLRAVELLPGITPLISGVPYFFVRGAPAGSVNFYIDEARIPQLYHVGPGSSVLHPDFVESVALRSGPYRARYGDATSGVVTTRVATEVNAFGVEAEAKAFESAAYVGTPIAEGRGAAAVAGKISHLRPLLDVINPELRLDYWDYQTFVAYELTPKDRLTLLVFGAGDFVGEVEEGAVDINIQTEFHRLKVAYDKNLASGVDLSNHVILGLDDSRFGNANEQFRGQSIGAGSSLSYVVDETWEWATGASLALDDIDASNASAFYGEPHNAAVSRVDGQAALWLEGRVSPVRAVKMDGGLRLAGYDSLSARAAAIEPRLSSTLHWSDRADTILAVGYSTQAPTTSVPTPAVRPAELRGDLQRALQRSATFRYHVPSEWSGEVTAFYNDYFNLSDPLSLATVADPLEIGQSDDGTEPDREDGNFVDRPNGRSHGLEFMLRRPFNNDLSGTVSYTLSRSTRRIADQNVPSSFDRTHILNTTLGYDFGRGYRFGTRVMVYSGLPVRRLGVVGGRTGERSDPFVRLDFRVSKQWDLSWSQLMLIAEILNATFEEEVLGVTCVAEGCVTATFGPVTVPSIGLRGTFGGLRTQSSPETSEDISF